jgi:error-prone DNA polymerase
MRPAPLPNYAELHCCSNYSFLTGASHPEELVQRAHALGYAALALTDECSLSGVVRAHGEAKRLGLHLIIGAEMRLTLPAQKAGEEGGAPHARLLLLAQSRRGYGNLSQWITVARRRAGKGCYLAHPSDLEGRVPHAPYLAGLPECFALLVLEQTQAAPPAFETAFAHAMWLKTWFGAERAGLAVSLRRQRFDDEMVDRAEQVAAATGLPVVATGDVLMHTRARKPLQDVLTATRLNCPVAECGWALQANAEAHLRSRQRLAQLYPAAWLAQTVRIAGECAFSLDALRYEYPREIVPDGHTPTSWLRRLTEEGARRRFPQGTPAPVAAQIEHELALIAQLQYEPYFLTVADLVQWARGEGILCQGRGSAANSAVCYCLHVTEVDPGRTRVLFERFISAERNEPPDIDVDFEHQRREEVIQYIYRKYGRHRAALTGVVISYRPRSALRDVGRALGFDLDRIEAVTRSHQWFDGKAVATERLSDNGFDPEAPLARLWMELTGLLIGFPRHLSQHPGGFVIARDDIARLVPVENAAMEQRTVIQWDKDDLDALGLIKVDVLALGMLSAIRRALAWVAFKRGGPEMRMQDIPEDDAAVFDMLCHGDSVGVFQVESRAQMSMLPRLQPRCYYDLVIQVAIVRPGPIQGGMVHPYLRRRSGEEPADYPSDEVRGALERTLGVPIFQEQVMQLAILAADFTPGEADQLRRAMAAWKRKGGLGPFHQRLVGRMVEKGYTAEYAESIFKQIQGFGEYGFPESHAASFALLVYVSAWLKHHHPDAFLAGLLDSQPMGFYAPAQLVRDARAHGVPVREVAVETSEWECTLEAGNSFHAVRLGLGSISGFPKDAALRLVAARAQAPFKSVEDLARRAALDRHALQTLAQSGALAGLAGDRHAAAWATAGIDTQAPPLLASTRTEEAAPPRLRAPSVTEDMLADYASLGLSLTTHPLALLRATLAGFKVLPADVLKDFRPGQLARASGLVTHRQRPGTAKGVVFVTLEDETGAVNVIVWPQVVEAQRKPLLAARLLTVYGVWQCQGEVRHLIAKRLIDHTALLQGLAVHSRDFR